MEIISQLVANFSIINIHHLLKKQTHRSGALVVVNRILHTNLLMFYQDIHLHILEKGN